MILEADPYLLRTADRLVIRVWDTEGELASHFDVPLEASTDFEWPARLVLRPRNQDASRTFLLVADLVTADGHGMSRVEVSETYVRGRSVTHEARFEVGGVDFAACKERELCADVDYGGLCFPAPTDEMPRLPVSGAELCPAIYVDGNSGEDRPPSEDGDDCRNPSTPCATIHGALDYFDDSNRGPGTVVNIAGDAIYRNDPPDDDGMIELKRLVSGPTGGRRTVFRHWPGRGVRRPEIDGSNYDATISFCCTGNDMSGAAQWVALDGLIVRGGYRAGIKINDVDARAPADSIVIRNCLIYGTGRLDPGGECPVWPGTFGVFLNNGADKVFVHNSVVELGESQIPAGCEDIPGRVATGLGINVISNDRDPADTSRVIQNTFRASDGLGIFTASVASVFEDNLIVGNQSGGIALGGQAAGNRFVGNRIQENAGPAIDLNGEDNLIADNFFSENDIVSNGGPAFQISSTLSGDNSATRNLLACNEVATRSEPDEAFVAMDNTLVCNEPGSLDANVNVVQGCDIDDCTLAALEPYRGDSGTGGDIGALEHPDQL